MTEGYGVLLAAMNALPKPAGSADLPTYTRFVVWTLGSLKPTEAELAELTRRAGMRCRFRPAPAELVTILREIRAERPEPVWCETVASGVAGQPSTVRILWGDAAVAAKAAYEREQAAKPLPSPAEVEAARAAYRAKLRELFGIDEVSA